MARLGEIVADVGSRVARACEQPVARVARLAELFATAPRPLFEIYLRCGDPRPELILGFRAPARRDELATLAREVAGDDAGELAEAWLGASSERAMDWGIKVPLAGDRIQIYGRWRIGQGDIAAALAASGSALPAAGAATRAALGALDRTFAQMLGIDLAAGRPPIHVAYVSTPNRPDPGAARRRVAGLVESRLASTEWPERWPRLGAALIGESADEHLYVSFDLAATTGELKVDTGSSSLADLGPIAAELGLTAELEETRALLARLEIDALSHVGVRMRGDGSATLGVYARAL